ncbi:tRNA pseudouridine(38-40) synthase TruA [Mycoplasmatota bacterium WC44]
MVYRVKCTVSYDGTNFCGWQVQSNQSTVQGKIEEGLKKLHNGVSIKTYGASRTDTGVHAVNQVFHFDTEMGLSEYRWKIAINNFLPNDVFIKNVELVSEEFHSRFNVKKKKYKYLINIGDYDPLLRNRMHHEKRKLDIDVIKSEISSFVGKHNFKSFTGGTVYENYVREIYEASLIQKGEYLEFTFVGSGFLRYMVRTMVGTLLEVGYGRKENIKEIIAKEDRYYAGKSASSHGLYLEKIWY